MPLHDVSHGLDIERMRSPEQCGQPGGKQGTHGTKTHVQEEPLEQQPDAQGGETEKKKVDDMVPDRVQLSDIIIERQAQVAERPVLREVLEGGPELDVLVCYHRGNVVKMERRLKARLVNCQRESE